MDTLFKLKKSFGSYKKGQKFNCFDGFVRGISDEKLGKINFDDPNYFELVKPKIVDIGLYIKDVENFPKEGIKFKDITPLLKNPRAFKESIKQMCALVKDKDIDHIVCPESRGFIFGTPMSIDLDAGFIPVRKKGKLPRKTMSVTYQLEYGEDTLEMHYDIKPGERVVIVDDVLATGGTLSAICKMVEMQGGIVEDIICLIEIEGLGGREKLEKYPVTTILKY